LLKFNSHLKEEAMNLKKKILFTFLVSSLAVVVIFGISTNLLAIGYTVTTIGDYKSCQKLAADLDNVNEELEKEGLNITITEEMLANVTEVSGDDAVVTIDTSKILSGIFKTGTTFLYVDFTGCGGGILELTDLNGKDISGYQFQNQAL
jgi:hypothetical protein